MSDSIFVQTSKEDLTIPVVGVVLLTIYALWLFIGTGPRDPFRDQVLLFVLPGIGILAVLMTVYLKRRPHTDN